MHVDRHIGGSHCVITLRPGLYIDARKDARHPDKSFIEVVRAGRVRYRCTVPDYAAPRYLIELAKSLRMQ